MMLLHHPGKNDAKAYKALERACKQGKIRSLGLSNFYIQEIDRFLPQILITPGLVQNEIHPFYQDRSVINHIHRLGIAVQAWYPLGGRDYNKELLSHPVLKQIAARHKVSIVQTILRWDLQNGVIVIPGSSNPDHIRENLDLFGFSLSEEEMEAIDSLERREKHDWY